MLNLLSELCLILLTFHSHLLFYILSKLRIQINCFGKACILTCLVPCCDVRYHFHIKTMFGSSLPPVVCRKAHVQLCLLACICISYCVALCFLFVCHRSVFCVPNVASFSGFSILDCPFGFL